METERAYRAVVEAAKRQGTTADEVIASIDLAIRETIETVYASNDQQAIALWKEIPCAGVVPTALELIAYLGTKVEKECRRQREDADLLFLS